MYIYRMPLLTPFPSLHTATTHPPPTGLPSEEIIHNPQPHHHNPDTPRPMLIAERRRGAQHIRDMRRARRVRERGSLRMRACSPASSSVSNSASPKLCPTLCYLEGRERGAREGEHTQRFPFCEL